MSALKPISTIDQIREIDGELESLLEELDRDDWGRPAVKEWRVRDVAAHLLDTNLRRLSLDRDRHQPEGTPPPEDPESFESWVDFLNRLNAEWTRAAERLSPGVILQLLRITNRDVTDYFASLDPDAPATFGVRWARESESKVWLDIAREYTEKWHHQQQIRDAVGRAGLRAPHLLLPLIETLLRSVPLAYGSVKADRGATLVIATDDLEGGAWMLKRDDGEWNLYESDDTVKPDATIRMSSDAMWRLLMKQISRDDACADAEASGPRELVTPFFEAVAVMA